MSDQEREVLQAFIEAVEDGIMWKAYRIQQYNPGVIKGETYSESVELAKAALAAAGEAESGQ